MHWYATEATEVLFDLLDWYFLRWCDRGGTVGVFRNFISCQLWSGGQFAGHGGSGDAGESKKTPLALLSDPWIFASDWLASFVDRILAGRLADRQTGSVMRLGSYRRIRFRTSGLVARCLITSHETKAWELRRVARLAEFLGIWRRHRHKINILILWRRPPIALGAFAAVVPGLVGKSCATGGFGPLSVPSEEKGKLSASSSSEEEPTGSDSTVVGSDSESKSMRSSVSNGAGGLPDPDSTSMPRSP
ncbi:hypothetical protein EVAR_13344_1 [Eumeta japonica]|uniref:Uncharacterized protein n=1 Tax=Eumeta variegata TaxID=151549 RepID=A0A4C1TS41_EUMVA|nr:hypothetical protein EVAR_13344_1 [Eumeta japonica]